MTPVTHIPNLGWYVVMRVFVPDGDDMRALVGPYGTAVAARADAPRVERGVLHIATPE